MANNQGGARIGAGRKKKPLADKIADGNTGHRKIEVVDFGGVPDLPVAEVPKPGKYMTAKQVQGDKLQAKEIFEHTWKWLAERGCEKLVTQTQVEHYAMSAARWIQCEIMVSQTGFLAKHPTTGQAMASPFVAMSQNYMKQVNSLWLMIYQTVRENSLAEYEGVSPHDEAMERTLAGR